MKTLTIISGIDGVGKTSMLGILSAKRRDIGIIIDADFIDEKTAVYKHNHRKRNRFYP